MKNCFSISVLFISVPDLKVKGTATAIKLLTAGKGKVNVTYITLCLQVHSISQQRSLNCDRRSRGREMARGCAQTTKFFSTVVRLPLVRPPAKHNCRLLALFRLLLTAAVDPVVQQPSDCVCGSGRE